TGAANTSFEGQRTSSSPVPWTPGTRAGPPSSHAPEAENALLAYLPLASTYGRCARSRSARRVWLRPRPLVVTGRSDCDGDTTLPGAQHDALACAVLPHRGRRPRPARAPGAGRV